MKADALPSVVFLDFDGVIRVAVEGGWVSADQMEFCQGRMKMLAQVCEATGAQIVVSSDWRRSDNLEQIQDCLAPYLKPHLHVDWSTPICGVRWKEVERWLSDHPEVKRYAVLDDCAVHFEGCNEVMRSRLVLCTNRFGLVPELVRRLAVILTFGAGDADFSDCLPW